MVETDKPKRQCIIKGEDEADRPLPGQEPGDRVIELASEANTVSRCAASPSWLVRELRAIAHAVAENTKAGSLTPILARLKLA